MRSLHDYQAKLPSFTFFGGCAQSDSEISFSFFNIEMVLRNSTKEEFACIWQKKTSWNNRDRQIERMQIHFWSDVFAALAIAVYILNSLIMHHKETEREGSDLPNLSPYP